MSTHAKKSPVEEFLVPVLEDELEGALRGCLSLFSDSLGDLSDINANHGVVLIDVFGVFLESPDDVAGLVLVAVFDELQ